MGGEGTNTQKVKLVLTNAEYLSIVKLLTVGCFVVVNLSLYTYGSYAVFLKNIHFLQNQSAGVRTSPGR